MPVEEGSGHDSGNTGDDRPPATTLGHSPVSSIIRPQLWVHWTITLLCLAAWGGMMYLGDLAEQTDFGLRDILGLRSGRVTNFFSTIMLLWAGQLSLLIYWYRRKSRNDFDGRYRMWLWIGGMLQLFLVVAATGAHRPFSQYMQRMWPMDIPLYGLLVWLVPIATLGLAMYRMLRIELKRHRSGKFLLNVSGTAAVIAAAALTVGPLLPARVRDLAQIGSATLAHLALATALLMHARYVVHISNEVPRRRQRPARRLLAAIRSAVPHLPLPGASRLKRAVSRRKLARPRLPRLALPKLSLPSVRLPRPKAPKLAPPKRDQDTAAAQKQAGQRSTATSRDQKNTSTPASRSVTPKPKSVETRALVTSRKPKRQQPQDHHRVDSAEVPKGPRRAPTRSVDDILDEYGDASEIDAETLSGLSKKQRRRLRKKQRELQRAGK